MKIKNQIYYLINLLNETKFVIFFILIFFTSSAIIYYNKLEYKKFSDIRITAIPKVSQESVDVFTLFESTFRDTKNFEIWKKSNTDTEIQSQQISGYQLEKNKLIVDNSIKFKNAKTYSRSIYLTIPARNSKDIRDFFAYTSFIVDKINNSNLFDKKIKSSKLTPTDEFFTLYTMIKSSIALNLNIDNIPSEDFLNKKYMQQLMHPDVNDIRRLKKIYDDYVLQNNLQETIPSPLLVISPPEGVYSNKIKLSKLLFISTLFSLLSIVLFLIYVDYKKNYK